MSVGHRAAICEAIEGDGAAATVGGGDLGGVKLRATNARRSNP